MPQAAIHVLIPLILVSLFRDYYVKRKNKKSFPLHYVLIAGISGILPDLDVVAFWILYFFGFTFEQVHRTFLHSLFIPLFFFLLFGIFRGVKVRGLGKHKLQLNMIFLMLAFGIFTHLFLDSLFGEPLKIFYPISSFIVGINLVGYLPKALQGIAFPSLDAALLIIWLLYLHFKHRISDFV